MEDEKKETVDTQTTENENEETVDTTEEQSQEQKVDYVKIRVNRAKKQKTKEILKELDAEDLDEIKNQLTLGKKALEQVEELKSQLAEKERVEKINLKKSLLTKVLENEKVFDAEALINYVDLEKVKITDGKIDDTENIINALKEKKPNFFVKEETKTDEFNKGNSKGEFTPLDKQRKGDNIGALNDYLKSIL